MKFYDYLNMRAIRGNWPLSPAIKALHRSRDIAALPASAEWTDLLAVLEKINFNRDHLVAARTAWKMYQRLRSESHA